jgi:GAF domain-containing protein
MTHHISVPDGTKEQTYAALIPQIRELVKGETSLIANMSNIAAALMQTFRHHWIGFYIVDGKTLVLHPFQGPVACTRIPYGKGVCGTAWSERRTVIVPDVDKFPGHIACSSASRSEIVVPLISIGGDILGVLDIDSAHLDAFDPVDDRYLTIIAGILTGIEQEE